jgi:hypothetical protein
MVMRERSAKCLFVRIPQRGARPPVEQDYFAIRKIPESFASSLYRYTIYPETEARLHLPELTPLFFGDWFPQEETARTLGMAWIVHHDGSQVLARKYRTAI